MASNEHEIRAALQHIYESRDWGEQEKENGGSLSGDGSGIAINRVRAAAISMFSQKMGVERIIDVGCGDCAWQKGFVDNLPPTVDYHGLDVAPSAVRAAQARCSASTRMTIHEPIDASSEGGYGVISALSAQRVTLAIVKEAIQHIPLRNGIQLLRNLQRAGVRYLAITHHDKALFPDSGNRDVPPGGMYQNDVYDAPFNLKDPLADTAQLISDDYYKRSMGNLLFFDLQAQSLFD